MTTCLSVQSKPFAISSRVLLQKSNSRGFLLVIFDYFHHFAAVKGFQLCDVFRTSVTYSPVPFGRMWSKSESAQLPISPVIRQQRQTLADFCAVTRNSVQLGLPVENEIERASSLLRG